ncbi:MAG: tyrosine-type recombinase/integrase [Spirochaetales bacterium]|nr:tyrosine-type recombinase/integrase [Spirochaetales bacterium]
MRYREPFTVYKRTLSSGKRIFYYYTYDENNKRTNGFSTGKKTRSAAKAYCFELLRQGKLIPKRGGNLTFKVYATDWWDWDKCEYIAYRSKRRTISKSYALTARHTLNKHILPRFGKVPIKTITTYDIEKWQDSFSDMGLANATARLSLTVLRVMLKEAVRRKLIHTNPAKAVTPLKNESKVTGILKTSEVEKLFDEKNKEKLWPTEILYLGNLLAACTGMRLGEVLGVRGESLKDNYILVDKQFNRTLGLTDTKSHGSREVIIPTNLYKRLQKLSKQNSNGYLFSRNGGTSPIQGDVLRNALQHAMREIGITDEERKERRITFHSWRHYLNTTLRSNNITDAKLRAMVGHANSQMTDHYTHFNPDDYKDIQKVQNKIIKISKVG